MFRGVLWCVTLCTAAALTQHLSAQSIYEPYSIATLAGNSGYGSVDAVGTDARFDHPFGAAVDSSGNVFVADTENHTIRKITPAGSVSTFAGLAGHRGAIDGTGRAARFDKPIGLVVDSAGNIYVADHGSHTIRKITPAGAVNTIAGLAGSMGSAEGAGSAARFRTPQGVAVDRDGNVYVADAGNHTIRKVHADGTVTTLAGLAGVYGSEDGSGAAARFALPRALATDSAGNIYVADASNSTIRKVTPDGVVSTFAGSPGVSGSTDGIGSAARFNNPQGVTVDRASGTLYVGDTGSRKIRRITAAGEVSTFAGSGNGGHADGPPGAAQFSYPAGVAVDASGNVYVADYYNHLIRKVAADRNVTTLAGSFANGGTADGVGGAARFNYPEALAVNPAGDVFVADSGSSTIRKITSAGAVTTFAGSPLQTGSANGTGTAARFWGPRGIAADRSGNLYVADTYNHTIRKISAAGVVSTVAGLAATFGSADGTGSNARFYYPKGIAVDAEGNIFVGDTSNHTIRKITPTGVVSTIAGLTGSAGHEDGNGSSARFGFPTGLGLDQAGNLYVGDNLTWVIRKVTPAGDVMTVAGVPQGGSADGHGSAARFTNPHGLAVDSEGNLFVADQGNPTIRKIAPSGMVTTIAGAPGELGAMDGRGRLARFDRPAGIAADANGHIYIADTFNDTIRVGRIPPGPPEIVTAANGGILVRGRAKPNSVVEIKATTDLLMNATPIGTASTTADGLYEFEDTERALFPSRFYEVAIPVP
jgi:sugar lactone lactonase YvrE